MYRTKLFAQLFFRKQVAAVMEWVAQFLLSKIRVKQLVIIIMSTIAFHIGVQEGREILASGCKGYLEKVFIYHHPELCLTSSSGDPFLRRRRGNSMVQ